MRKYILLLLCAAIVQNLFARKHKLGLNLKAGETYYHIMQAESIVDEEINGQPMTITMNISGKIAFNVTEVKDSMYNMRVNYQQLAFSILTPNGTSSFSSEKNDSTDVFSAILHLIKDKYFSVRMTNEGIITQVQNLDTVFEEVLDKNPQLSIQRKEAMKAQLTKAFGEKSFKSSFEMVTAIYPHTAVDTGDTWIIKTQLETGMEGILITNFQYTKETDSCNIITGNGKIETADKDAYMQVNGMPIKYNLSGTMNSSIKVDKHTGWVVASTVQEKLSGTAEVKDNPKMPGGLTIPMTFKTEMAYKNH